MEETRHEAHQMCPQVLRDVPAELAGEAGGEGGGADRAQPRPGPQDRTVLVPGGGSRAARPLVVSQLLYSMLARLSMPDMWTGSKMEGARVDGSNL